MHEPQLKDQCVLELYAHTPRAIVHEVRPHYASCWMNTKEGLLPSEQVGNIQRLLEGMQ